MIANFTKQLLSGTLSILLIIATTPLENRAQQTGSAGYSGQGVPLSAKGLQQLAAPIALYPDSLVAQILAAASEVEGIITYSNISSKIELLKENMEVSELFLRNLRPKISKPANLPPVVSATCVNQGVEP